MCACSMEDCTAVEVEEWRQYHGVGPLLALRPERGQGVGSDKGSVEGDE